MNELQTIPSKGLVIKKQWLNLILEGDKTWEIRGTNTRIRGEIALIQSGTGHIFGTIELIDSQQLSLEDYQKSQKFHCISREMTITSPYKNIHAWVLKNPKKLKTPIPYKHPQGAVIWVNLLKNIQY